MDNNLQNFSKHVPQILRQQLLLKLSKKFLNETHEEWNQEDIRSPTIQRFRGALLFVDISGFTVLSQRLDIESLKNHINDYFTKMLTIVDKWGGDVVKFAGDALFIIWHSQILDSEENHHSSQNHSQQQAKEAVDADDAAEQNRSSKKAKLPAADALMSEAAERAIACALEICASCGHYEVKLQRTGSDAHTHMFDRFMPARRNSTINSGKIAPLDAANGAMKSIYNANNNNSNNNNSNNVGNTNDENNVTYLDVHCGISMGLMAGIDIGQGDRWEFFLAGNPLSDVAAAEEKAKKGDVVVSELLHRAVHRDECTNAHEEFLDSEGNMILSCGCALLADGYCRVKKVDIKPPRKARKNRLKARKEGFQAIAYENSRIIEDTTHDMEMLFIALYPIFRKMYQSITNPSYNTNTNSSHGTMLVRPQSGKDVSSPLNMNGNNGTAGTAVVPARKIKDRRNDQLAAFINMELKRTYYSSISKVLTDDLARHVHDAVRSDYEFNDVGSCEGFWDTTNSMPGRSLPSQNNAANVQGAASTPQLGQITNDEPNLHPANGNAFGANLMVLTNASNTLSSAGAGNNNSNSNNNHFPSPSSPSAGGANTNNTMASHRKNHQNNYYSSNSAGNNNNGGFNAMNVTAAQLAVSSEILTSNAEVRSVTVMFIKIDTINLQLFVDEAENCNQGDVRVPDDEHNKVFGFLVRTEKEIAADTAILHQLQGCFSILHHAIYDNGGQLRQFIVDDKGTVCIATFGLRGAVSVDNAASAIETAHQIIQALPSLQLSASIGITTGKAYCGLVGSPLRHEYAVMGPSTNLSARLMCKAGPHTVICDEDTMRRDRLHEYQPLSEIQAKGYANPVKIFRPAFQGMMPETIKPSPYPLNSPFHPANQLHNAHGNAHGHPLPPPSHPGAQNSGSNVNNSSGTHLTLKVAARQVGRARKDTRFASMYTYLMRKMHLDWILSNRSKWELEIRDMINSPFFYENEFNKAQRKSLSETSVSINNSNHNNNNNDGSSPHSSTHSGNYSHPAFHGIPTPIRKLHGRKKEVKRILTALLPPLQTSGNVMFGFDHPSQMVVISGGMGSGKTAVLSAIARKIQFMAERDRCLNIFLARKKSITMKSKIPFSFWKPMVISLITLFTKDTTATSLPATGRAVVSSHLHHHHQGHGAGGGGGTSPATMSNLNMKKVIICLDKMLKIFSREQLAVRDLLIKILIAEDDSIFHSNELKASDLANVAEAFATLIDFMPNLANRFIIIFIEDVHFLDPWSLRVMLLIWQKATGISLLATYDADQTPPDESHSFDHAQLHRIVHQPSRLLNNNSNGQIFGSNASSAAGINNSNSNTNDKDHAIMFRWFNDMRRFAIVDLPPLDKDSTIKVAKEALSDVGIIATDADLAKLYDISGGNPLYTIELTKALQTIHHQTHAARMQEENNNNTGGQNPDTLNAASLHSLTHPQSINTNTNHGNNNNSDIKADLNELFNMNSRVEEVICYRFDKLTTNQQLVLKAASIAVSNGRNFTAEMIVYLLEESDQFSVASDLMPNRAHGGLAAHLHTGQQHQLLPSTATSAQVTSSQSPQNMQNSHQQQQQVHHHHHHHEAVDRILLHLVHHHDFIKLIQTHDRSGAHQGKQYNFTIPLEQTSIYQLVIDEQKQWFHERMAMYCRQSASRRKNDAIDDRLADLKEEAFHWEHATSWGNALKALMFCATCERQRGNEIAWLQHLQSCYGLYKQLEQDMFANSTSLSPVMEEKLPSDPSILCRILLQQSQQSSACSPSVTTDHNTVSSIASNPLSHNNNASNNNNSNHNYQPFFHQMVPFPSGSLPNNSDAYSETYAPNHSQQLPPQNKQAFAAVPMHEPLDDDVAAYLRTLDREMAMMFESFAEVDADVAAMIFYLHVSLADAYILAWEDMKILLHTLGVCLRLCLAAKYCDAFPAKTRAMHRQKWNANSTSSVVVLNHNRGNNNNNHNSNNNNNQSLSIDQNNNSSSNFLFLASASRDDYETSSRYTPSIRPSHNNNNHHNSQSNNNNLPGSVYEAAFAVHQASNNNQAHHSHIISGSSYAAHQQQFMNTSSAASACRSVTSMSRHISYHFYLPTEYIQHFLSTLCLAYYTSLQYVSRRERDVFGSMKLMLVPEVLLSYHARVPLGARVSEDESNCNAQTPTINQEANATDALDAVASPTVKTTEKLVWTMSKPLNVGDDVQNLVLQTLYHQHHGEFAQAYQLWQAESPTLRFHDLEIAIESSKTRLMKFGMDTVIFVTGQFLQWFVLSGKDLVNQPLQSSNKSPSQLPHSHSLSFEASDSIGFGDNNANNNNNYYNQDLSHRTNSSRDESSKSGASFVRTELLNSFYHIPHVASLEYLTIFALPACVFNDDYDTAIQCRAHYRHALQQYTEQVEVSSPALKQVLIMWSRAGMVVYQYADQFALYSSSTYSNQRSKTHSSINNGSPPHSRNNQQLMQHQSHKIQQQVEIFDMVDAARVEDLYAAIDTAEFLNRTKMTGSNDCITMLTLQCMVARGMCLNSLVLQMLLALLMLLPTTSVQEMAPIDELFEKWFNRLVHTMVLASQHQSNRSLSPHSKGRPNTSHNNNIRIHDVSEPSTLNCNNLHANSLSLLPPSSSPQQPYSEAAVAMAISPAFRTMSLQDDSMSQRLEDSANQSERSVDFSPSAAHRGRDAIGGEGDARGGVDAAGEMGYDVIVPIQNPDDDELLMNSSVKDTPHSEGPINNENASYSNSNMKAAPRLLGSGLGETGSGAWNILNVLNPLSLLAKVLDQRFTEQISLQIPLTMGIVRDFLRQHVPHLLVELHEQELYGAEQSLQWLRERIVTLDESVLSQLHTPLAGAAERDGEGGKP